MASDFDLSTSSSSEDENEGRRNTKRKWKEFFNSLLQIVLEKQEELQKKVLEALDRSESERIAREESWKAQELARIRREQEQLEQERAITAAKDAAVIAFLEKISESLMAENPNFEEKNEGGEDSTEASRVHRWPEDEVQAVSKIRTEDEGIMHHPREQADRAIDEEEGGHKIGGNDASGRTI